MFQTYIVRLGTGLNGPLLANSRCSTGVDTAHTERGAGGMFKQIMDGISDTTQTGVEVEPALQ
jgi:hypothetical protein